jgi:hypothetical protein
VMMLTDSGVTGTRDDARAGARILQLFLPNRDQLVKFSWWSGAGGVADSCTVLSKVFRHTLMCV